MEFSPLLTSMGTAIFVGGVAWGATKSALNGTRMRVQQIHEELRSHIRDESSADMETHERITRVETKLDMLIDRVK